MNQPASHCLLQPLQRLAVMEADPVPFLPLAPPITSPSSPCLILHPGSGSDQKNWPEPQWHEFLSTLAGVPELTPWHFLLVGGEAEGDRLERLIQVLPTSRATLAKNLPLPELAATMAAQGKAFVGHDSGISHLAAALKIPGRILWGPTAEKVWRPLGEHIRILHDPRGLPHLPIDLVLQQTVRLLQSVARRASDR